MAENKIIRPQIHLTYNSKDCSEDFSKYLRSLEYKDYEDSQSDELSIVLNNNDGYFHNSWYPKKGAKLTADIIFGIDTFSCGTFTIDDNSFDFSLSGDLVEIKALATTVNYAIRTNKYKNHSGKTLNKIASDIGKSYGFSVLGNEGNVSVGEIIQKNESDMSFLKRLALLYGYIFNIKDGYLTFTPIDSLEGSDALFSLDKTKIQNLSLSDSTAKVYGSAKAAYFDTKAKIQKTYTAYGNSEFSDTIVIYKKFSSLKEAQIAANAALREGSREVKGRVALVYPEKNFIAGVNFNIEGYSRFDGKYHIKSHVRRIDEQGYRVEGDIVKV